jgi:hypothetical protein
MASVRYVIDSFSVSVEKRRVGGRRRRAQIVRESGEDARVGQAELSLYFAAGLLFLTMAVFSFKAKDHVAAVAVTLQAGTVLLISPEVLRPFRGLSYFNRPLSEIRAKKRRNLRRAAIVFILALVPLAFRILGPPKQDRTQPWSELSTFGALLHSSSSSWASSFWAWSTRFLKARRKVGCRGRWASWASIERARSACSSPGSCFSPAPSSSMGPHTPDWGRWRFVGGKGLTFSEVAR